MATRPLLCIGVPVLGSLDRRMRMRRAVVAAAALFAAASICAVEGADTADRPWLDSSKTIEERVHLLMSAMTVWHALCLALALSPSLC